MNLRGRIVTVLDLRDCLGLASTGYTETGCVIVIDANNEILGYRVDRVADICSVASGAIKALPPAMGALPGDLVRGVVTRNGSMLTLLDANRVSLTFQPPKRPVR
jgi:purine-binding chemotaxis protein CheW